MAYEDYRIKMDELRSYIKRERTGDVDTFAKKLGISRRTLFNYLGVLRDEGLTVKFCRIRKTYHYHNK